MRVLILPKYGALAASTRYRFLQFVPALRSRGWDVSVRPLLDDVYLDRRFRRRWVPWLRVVRAYSSRTATVLASRDVDLVVFNYELLPYVPGWLEAWLVRAGVPYVVDLDDAMFLNYELSRVPLVRQVFGLKVPRLIARASAVIAGNSYLAEFARRHARTVEVVPTVVDTERYRAVSRDPGRQPFTVGWMGSPSTAPYLEPVVEALSPWLQATGSRLLVVGAQIAQPRARVECRPWVETRELDDLAEFDIGIMPLPDTEWAKGKCGFKLVQYMATGLPVVTSPVGVNSDLVEHGANGFLAASPAAWAGPLEQLRASPGLRTDMGRRGRVRVEAGFSRASAEPRVVGILERAAAGS